MDLMTLLFGKRIAAAFTKSSAKPNAAKTSETASVKAPSAPAKTSENKSAKAPEAKSVSKSVEGKSAVGSVSKPVKKKNFFFVDIDYLVVVLILVIVLFGAKAYAFSISAPDSVIINDTNSFTVDLVNDSSSAQNISVNFFSPAKSSISYPKQLAPNSTGKATITIYNNINKVEDVTATVEVVAGEQIEQKEVNLSFKENFGGSFGAALSGLFSFGLFNKEVSTFSGFDWLAFWVLVIIAAVLVVSFVSRLVKFRS